MKPYYYVNRRGDRAPIVPHQTLQEAKNEAERLAIKHPGEAFEILAAIGISRISQSSTFWMDGISIS